MTEESKQALVDQMAGDMVKNRIQLCCELTVPAYLNAIEELRIRLQEEQGYEVIEFTKWRIKSPESIVEKLLRKGRTPDFETAVASLNDLVGIRIVTTLYEDVYTVVDAIKEMEIFKIRKIKDYVKEPKDSGYRSVHIILDLELGIYTIGMEIQVRSEAMNFWSVLQHMASYHKYDKDDKESKKIERELVRCSIDVAKIDRRMEKIHQRIDHKIEKAKEES